MHQALSRRARVPARGLALALALAVGWPLGAVSSTDEPELEVEVIGEGIERVLADSVGHRFDRRPLRDVAIAPDGTVWLVQGRRILQLDQPGSTGPRSDRWQHFVRRIELTPDGELWAVEDGGTVVRLTEGVLEDRSDGRRSTGGSLAAFPDGELGRTVRGEEGLVPVVSTNDGASWQELPSAGLEWLLGPGLARHVLARTDDGRTWIGVDRGPLGGGLAVFDGTAWTPVEVVAGTRDLRVAAVVPGDEGSVWALAQVGQPGGQGRHVLIRLHEGGISVLGEEQGMPQDTSLAWISWSPLEPIALAVDARGRVWFSVGDIGVWVYDGDGFERVRTPALRAGALDIEAAADGHVWVVSRAGQLLRLDEAAHP